MALTNWYDYPRYYDLAFRSETRREADFIEAACRKYCPFAARRLLEPACGTGRLVTELAARGYRMTGFDLNRPALDYLRRRLARRGLRARVLEADMADFRLAAPVDAAFCPVNTFRHLLSEESARSHLECIAAALRPGGIYVLGLHLLPPDASEEDGERWTERQGRTQVTVTLRVLATDRRRRVERLRVSLLVRTGMKCGTTALGCARSPAQPRAAVLRRQTASKEIRLRDEFSFRMYTARQFRRLLASVPSLELCDVYDFWYEIDYPMELNDDRADTVFVLRRK
jgi:SAM-dependent methyltransferase